MSKNYRADVLLQISYDSETISHTFTDVSSQTEMALCHVRDMLNHLGIECDLVLFDIDPQTGRYI